MSRTTTRITAGFAVFAFAAFGAGPAWASDEDAAPLESQGEQATDQVPGLLDAPVEEPGPVSLDYTCVVPGTGHSETVPVDWYFSAASSSGTTELQPGDTISYAGAFEGDTTFFVEDGGAFTSLTSTGTVGLSGGAAPADAVTVAASWSGDSENPYESDEGWNWDGLAGEITVDKGGDLVFTAGSITAQATQDGGTVTDTECTPATEAELASFTVAGGDGDGDGDGDGGGDGDDGEDDPGPGDGDGDGDGDGGDDGTDPGTEEPGGGEDGGENGGDDKPAPGDGADGDDSASGGLPVTGAALGGLIAAAVAAVGGGGAAMYFSRKKKAAEADSDSGA